MPGITGTAAVISWIHPSGTATLNTKYRRFNPSARVDNVDASGGADTYRDKLPTLADASATFEYVYQDGGTVIFAALTPNTVGTLIVQKQGTATGKPKMTVPAFVGDLSETLEFDQVNIVSVTFEYTAAPVYTTN